MIHVSSFSRSFLFFCSDDDNLWKKLFLKQIKQKKLTDAVMDRLLFDLFFLFIEIARKENKGKKTA